MPPEMAAAPEAPANAHEQEKKALDASKTWPTLELPTRVRTGPRGYSEIGVYEPEDGDLEAGTQERPGWPPVQAALPPRMEWAKVAAGARRLWKAVKGFGMEEPISPEEHEAQLSDCACAAPFASSRPDELPASAYTGPVSLHMQTSRFWLFWTSTTSVQSKKIVTPPRGRPTAPGPRRTTPGRGTSAAAATGPPLSTSLTSSTPSEAGEGTTADRTGGTTRAAIAGSSWRRRTC